MFNAAYERYTVVWTSWYWKDDAGKSSSNWGWRKFHQYLNVQHYFEGNSHKVIWFPFMLSFNDCTWPFTLNALQWFGEGEKYVKAVFSLASKIAPSVIFVDEVCLKILKSVLCSLPPLKPVFLCTFSIWWLWKIIIQVDSMLGRRENPGEHEAMRKMKNEFMVNWDGLRTKDRERVLVLAATNRPFDLDEAVIRRLPRR